MIIRNTTIKTRFFILYHHYYNNIVIPVSYHYYYYWYYELYLMSCLWFFVYVFPSFIFFYIVDVHVECVFFRLFSFFHCLAQHQEIC